MSFTLGAVAAFICIVLGFVAGIADEDVLFNALTWFVAAIAFGTIGGPVVYKR